MSGVTQPGYQNTSGNAATATKLAQSVYIGGVEFDGSEDVDFDLSLFTKSIDLTPSTEGVHIGLRDESEDVDYLTDHTPYIKLSSGTASSRGMYEATSRYEGTPYQITHYLNPEAGVNEPLLLKNLSTNYDNMAGWLATVPHPNFRPFRITVNGEIDGPYLYRDSSSTTTFLVSPELQTNTTPDYQGFVREYTYFDENHNRIAYPSGPHGEKYFALWYYDGGTNKKYLTVNGFGHWRRDKIESSKHQDTGYLFASITDSNRIGECVIDFTKNEQESRGRIEYNFRDDSLRFSTSAITINYSQPTPDAGSGLGEPFPISSTSSPAAEVMRLTSDGRVGIGTDSPDTTLTVNGTCTATSYITGSDDRIKHNETEITHALEILNKLQPKHYLKTTKMYDADFTLQDDRSNLLPGDTATLEHGVIAQDLLEIPEVAFTVKENDGGMMSVDYNSLFVLAIQALKDLSVRHEELRSAYVAKVAQHDNDIQQMMTRLEALESSRISEE